MRGALTTPHGGIKTPVERIEGAQGMSSFVYSCSTCGAEIAFMDICGPREMMCACGHSMQLSVRKIKG